MKDNITLFLIIGILVVHFLAGVGFLLYKICGSKRPEDQDKD